MIIIGKDAREDVEYMFYEEDDTTTQEKIQALYALGQTIEEQFERLVIDRKTIDMGKDGPFHFYYLAQMTEKKVFWIFPMTVRRVLVAVNDRSDGPTLGCTVIEPLLFAAATQMTETLARKFGQKAKVLEEYDDPLFF
jgi:hypothetical protein